MLTERKQRFVEAYVHSGNASQSARQAGFSPKSASSYSTKLLKEDKEVIEAVELQRKRLQESIRLEREELYPSKDLYVKEAFSRSKTCPHAPTASKYYELGGKALGYLSDDKQSEAPIYQVIHNELNINFITARSARTKRALRNNHIPIDNKSSDNNLDENKNISSGEPDRPSPTQGANLSLIPLPKSPQILNSPSNESINNANAT